MYIRHIKNKEIDRVRWDQCISSSKNGLIYAYSWYLDIVAENWDALINKDYTIIMPLVWKKKFLIKYIYQPFFTQQSGIFSLSELTPEIIETFINAIPKKFKFVSLNLNSKNKLNSLDLKINNNYELSLNKPYEELFVNFRKKTKIDIRKAEKNNLTINNNIKSHELIKIKKENLNVNIQEKALKKLELLIEYCLKKKCAKIYGVYDKKKLLSAAFFMFSHNRTYYLISSTNSEGKNKRASFFLINAFIKEHAGKNLILDFEGSNIPGIARFFEGWGAEISPYYRFEYSKIPFISPFKIKI